MPFYLLILTDDLLCVAENSFLPPVFKDHMKEVEVFDRLDDVWWHINEIISYDDLWDFGLNSVGEIKVNKVYSKLHVK